MTNTTLSTEQAELLQDAGWSLIGTQPGILPDTAGMNLVTATKDVGHPSGVPCRIEKLPSGHFRLLAPLDIEGKEWAVMDNNITGAPLLTTILMGEYARGVNHTMGTLLMASGVLG